MPYFPLSHIAHVFKSALPKPVNLAEFNFSEQRDSTEISCILSFLFSVFITNTGLLIKSGDIE